MEVLGSFSRRTRPPVPIELESHISVKKNGSTVRIFRQGKSVAPRELLERRLPADLARLMPRDGPSCTPFSAPAAQLRGQAESRRFPALVVHCRPGGVDVLCREQMPSHLAELLACGLGLLTLKPPRESATHHRRRSADIAGPQSATSSPRPAAAAARPIDTGGLDSAGTLTEPGGHRDSVSDGGHYSGSVVAGGAGHVVPHHTQTQYESGGGVGQVPDNGLLERVQWLDCIHRHVLQHPAGLLRTDPDRADHHTTCDAAPSPAESEGGAMSASLQLTVEATGCAVSVPQFHGMCRAALALAGQASSGHPTQTTPTPAQTRAPDSRPAASQGAELKSVLRTSPPAATRMVSSATAGVWAGWACKSAVAKPPWEAYLDRREKRLSRPRPAIPRITPRLARPLPPSPRVISSRSVPDRTVGVVGKKASLPPFSMFREAKSARPQDHFHTPPPETIDHCFSPAQSQFSFYHTPNRARSIDAAAQVLVRCAAASLRLRAALPAFLGPGGRWQNRVHVAGESVQHGVQAWVGRVVSDAIPEDLTPSMTDGMPKDLTPSDARSEAHPSDSPVRVAVVSGSAQQESKRQTHHTASSSLSSSCRGRVRDVVQRSMGQLLLFLSVDYDETPVPRVRVLEMYWVDPVGQLVLSVADAAVQQESVRHIAPQIVAMQSKLLHSCYTSELAHYLTSGGGWSRRHVGEGAVNFVVRDDRSDGRCAQSGGDGGTGGCQGERQGIGSDDLASGAASTRHYFPAQEPAVPPNAFVVSSVANTDGYPALPEVRNVFCSDMGTWSVAVKRRCRSDVPASPSAPTTARTASRQRPLSGTQRLPLRISPATRHTSGRHRSPRSCRSTSTRHPSLHTSPFTAGPTDGAADATGGAKQDARHRMRDSAGLVSRSEDQMGPLPAGPDPMQGAVVTAVCLTRPGPFPAAVSRRRAPRPVTVKQQCRRQFSCTCDRKARAFVKRMRAKLKKRDRHGPIKWGKVPGTLCAYHDVKYQVFANVQRPAPPVSRAAVRSLAARDTTISTHKNTHNNNNNTHNNTHNNNNNNNNRSRAAGESVARAAVRRVLSRAAVPASATAQDAYRRGFRLRIHSGAQWLQESALHRRPDSSGFEPGPLGWARPPDSPMRAQAADWGWHRGGEVGTGVEATAGVGGGAQPSTPAWSPTSADLSDQDTPVGVFRRNSRGSEGRQTSSTPRRPSSQGHGRPSSQSHRRTGSIRDLQTSPVGFQTRPSTSSRRRPPRAGTAGAPLSVAGCTATVGPVDQASFPMPSRPQTAVTLQSSRLPGAAPRVIVPDNNYVAPRAPSTRSRQRSASRGGGPVLGALQGSSSPAPGPNAVPAQKAVLPSSLVLGWRGGQGRRPQTLKFGLE